MYANDVKIDAKINKDDRGLLLQDILNKLRVDWSIDLFSNY